MKLDSSFRNQRQYINSRHDLQEKGIYVRRTDGMIHTRALGNFVSIVIFLLPGLGELDRSMVIEGTQGSYYYKKEIGRNLGGRPKTNH